MKKILFIIIAIIVSIQLTNAQNYPPEIKGLTKEYVKTGCDHDFSDKWNEGIGLRFENIDSIIMVKLDNELKPVLLLVDTVEIALGDYFAIYVHEKYIHNGQIYFIYSTDYINIHYFEDSDGFYQARSQFPIYYTTEPYTTVKVKYEGEDNKIKRYTFFTDYRRNLNPKQVKRLQEVGLIGDVNWDYR